MRKPDKIMLPFPAGGLDEDRSRAGQESGTTESCVNVRAFDTEGRLRGGQRAGFDKYCSVQVNGANRVQCLTHAVSIQDATAAQTTLAIRTIKLLAVSNGTVRVITASSSTAPSVHTGTIDANAPVVFATSMYDDVYFFDGSNWTFYDNSADDVLTVTASAGTLPASGANTPRLCCTWSGRLVVSGITTDPQNWFMSAVNDPTDWDYTPTTLVETMAVAGNSADAAQLGDTVNCLMPYNNDILWVGCDHSIWQLSGNPVAGGRFDLVSDTIGIAWGQPYCKDDKGGMYFMSSRGAIYRVTPGEAPQRITAAKIAKRLQDLDLANSLVRMAWDDRRMGVHVWVTPLTAATTDHHLFYETRTDGWFPVRYSSPNHNPVAVHVFDGDSPGDREIVFGTENGYVMKYNDNSINDDGTAITSSVRFGPIVMDNGKYPFVMKGIQAVLDDDSSDVGYRVYAGNSAEDALSLTSGQILLEDGGGILTEDGQSFLIADEELGAKRSGTFSGIRSTVQHVRQRGFAVYIDIYNSTVDQSWSMEKLIADVSIVTTSKGRRL